MAQAGKRGAINEKDVAVLAVVLCVFVGVELFVGFFLSRKLMGGKTGLHPTVIIFSVFFWGIALDGILGMILAIPLTAFIAAAYARLFKEGQNSEDYQI